MDKKLGAKGTLYWNDERFWVVSDGSYVGGKDGQRGGPGQGIYLAAVHKVAITEWQRLPGLSRV